MSAAFAKRAFVVVATGLAALALWPALAIGQAAKAEKAAAKPAARPVANVQPCHGCHEPIKGFHQGSKHAGVACDTCHKGVDKHLGDVKSRPVTVTDPAACGACHRPQYETMYRMNFDKPARSEKSLATGPSPNPAWDKLMMPHGFTREHNLPRSHAFALLDQLVVDRAFGGRFEPKEGWRYLAQPGGNFKIWDMLEDKFPGQDHKAFKPGTAAAANPVCLSCKTQDHILDWAYLGDPVPGAKWSRASKVNEMVKDVNHALNCFFCHDPHSAGPRVVRDGLIQALTRPEKDTLWHKDARAAKIDVKDLGVRGYTRKIGLLDRYDTKLQCGQCHVEYNCNPGTDPTTGQPIGMGDARTNHFPFKNVFEITRHYTDLKFRDFRHGITGALLWKAQHPDVENYYDSKHQKAGIECHQCHMPKVKDAKTGKVFTSHWQTSPKHYIRDTCLQCHSQWDERQARYVIDSLNARYQGKLRKAEFWLTRFVDKFEEAKNAGVDESVLAAMREKHFEAAAHWEWWTASNGAGFHNPEMANESIQRGMAISQDAIKALDEAMARKRAEGRAPAAAPKASAAPAASPVALRR